MMNIFQFVCEGGGKRGGGGVRIRTRKIRMRGITTK